MQFIERTATAVFVSIVLVSTLTASVSATTGPLGGGNQTVDVDDQTQLAVTLEDAPDGIQRYNVTVRLGNSAIADIESASPGDVEAFQIRSQTENSVTFRAADLSQDVQAGATDVRLGTLTITATDPGTSTVNYIVHDFRTDDSEQISPSVRPGTLTVQSADVVANSRASAEEETPVQRATAFVPERPVIWGAGGAAIILALVGLLYRQRRTERNRS